MREGRQDSPYRRIVAEIRRRIEDGELNPGDRIPSARQITREWGVAIATATKVLALLRQDGLVRAVPGVGTVVAGVPSTAGVPSVGGVPSVVVDVAPHGRTGLTREIIVRTAIELADAEGASAISMRRIAMRLRVATMSLYRYVRGKDELVELMIDVIFGAERLPDSPSGGWRQRTEVICREQWAIYRRHPWLARFISVTRPLPASNAMDHTERQLRVLDGLGLDPATAMRIAVLFATFVLGIAAHLESEAEARAHTGVTSDEWMAERNAVYLSRFSSGRFPMLSRAAAIPEFDISLERQFELGLLLIMDGFDGWLSQAMQVGLDGGGGPGEVAGRE